MYESLPQISNIESSDIFKSKMFAVFRIHATNLLVLKLKHFLQTSHIACPLGVDHVIAQCGEFIDLPKNPNIWGGEGVSLIDPPRQRWELWKDRKILEFLRGRVYVGGGAHSTPPQPTRKTNTASAVTQPTPNEN